MKEIKIEENTKKIDLFGIKKIKKMPIEEGRKLNLTAISIPGRSVGHSLWRLSVHFKSKLKDILAFSIERYSPDQIGQEGAVRVIFWLNEKDKE